MTAAKLSSSSISEQKLAHGDLVHDTVHLLYHRRLFYVPQSKSTPPEAIGAQFGDKIVV